MTYLLKFSQNFLFYSIFISFCSLYGFEDIPSDEALRSRILYLLQTGKESTALDLYQNYFDKKGCHDGELLEQMALIIIEQGFNSDTKEAQILSMYGAGISHHEKILPLLKAGICSRLPEIQLISLNFLSRFSHDEADSALNSALNSDYLIIRLEAGFHLAEKKSPKIAAQMESLMQKIDPELLPLFPQFFALIGTTEAIKILTRLLNHPDENVRVQAIISAANFERDDLLPIIRKLATHNNVMQQEACSYAFGKLKDELSIPKLKAFELSNSESVRLAALLALYRLGQKQSEEKIIALAKELNPFAIYMLSEIEEAKPLLLALSSHEQLGVRINATCALLKSKQPKATSSLLEILVQDSRDLAFLENRSLGSTLKSLKATPSAFQNFKDNKMFHELSLHIREEILNLALKLPENDFLKIAKTLFETNQNELIPLLVLLLEDLQTKGAIDLLKSYSQKPGAPLIRNYCNLALFRLKEEGPYKDILENFILQVCKTDLIQLRPLLPFELRQRYSHYQLNPQDTSRLLIEIFESLTLRQDTPGINMLLHAIKHGNQTNKYALAGLLMHMAR